MRLLKDAYGEVYNKNDAIDDLNVIREELSKIHNSFSENTLKDLETKNSNTPLEKIVEFLISKNYSDTVESLGKIKSVFEKYHK